MELAVIFPSSTVVLCTSHVQLQVIRNHGARQMLLNRNGENVLKVSLREHIDLQFLGITEVKAQKIVRRLFEGSNRVNTKNTYH